MSVAMQILSRMWLSSSVLQTLIVHFVVNEHKLLFQITEKRVQRRI